MSWILKQNFGISIISIGIMKFFYWCKISPEDAKFQVDIWILSQEDIPPANQKQRVITVFHSTTFNCCQILPCKSNSDYANQHRDMTHTQVTEKLIALHQIYQKITRAITRWSLAIPEYDRSS